MVYSRSIKIIFIGIIYSTALYTIKTVAVTKNYAFSIFISREEHTGEVGFGSKIQNLTNEEHVEEHGEQMEYNKLPNIQMIGVQKAGTSAVSQWLYKNGACRPEIFGDEPNFYQKEVHFFDIKERYSRGIEFYTKRFRNCTQHSFSMDATPNTFLHSREVHDIYQAAGEEKNLKIILILRDPISRELSLYNHMLSKYLSHPSEVTWQKAVISKNGSTYNFNEYVENVLEAKIAREAESNMSLYADRLNEWTKYFDRDQILILNYDELRMQPELTQYRIRQFVGFNFPGDINKSNTKHGLSKVKGISCSMQKKLDEMFQENVEKLYMFLNQTSGPSMEQHPFPQFQKSSCV